jgi:hypothetical protein
MTFKNLFSKGSNYGWWGNNIHARVLADHTIDKVMQLNLDKLMTLGLPFALWQEASKVVTSPQQCSCFKTTTSQPDIPCLSCYGTGFLPGYIKFGTQTYWSSSMDAGWLFSGMELDTDNRPNRLRLTPTYTLGTAISALISLTTTSKIGVWDYHVDGFTRDGGAHSSVVVEFTDGVDAGLIGQYGVDPFGTGITWYPLSMLESRSPSVVRFRVSISRSAITVKSPVFEMVRIRFQTLADIRGELSEPIVRVVPTWDKQAELRSAYGNEINNAKRFWTIPLTFFDSTLVRETTSARIEPDAFVEVRYGGNVGFRHILTNFAYSDTFGEFTQQTFDLRESVGIPSSLGGEVIYRVW